MKDPILQLPKKKQELVESWIQELAEAGYTYDDMIALFRKAQRLWDASKLLSESKVEKNLKSSMFNDFLQGV